MLGLHLWWSGQVGDYVWMVVGTIVVAVRWLGVVIGAVVVVRRVVACEGLVLLGVLLRGYAIVYRCVMVCAGCGGWLSSCVVDRLQRAWGYILLGLLVFFSLHKSSALFGQVSLSWPAKVAINLHRVSLVGSVLHVGSVVILTGSGG